MVAGNVAAWLPFPTLSDRPHALAAALARQDPAAHLPAGTHPTVVAGYRAQLASLASALRGAGTAFAYLALSPGPASGRIVNLHPLSRGTVRLDPRDPHGREPLVDYRALSNPLDALVMADTLRFARAYYVANPAFAALEPQEVAPGPNVTSDADFAAYLARRLEPSLFHPCGTCAMLPRELGGVVDAELRVYGVRGLRVVDASVMPTIVGANTCQTVYAVAEKVSVVRGKVLVGT
jgi:choline dehydrogenase